MQNFQACDCKIYKFVIAKMNPPVTKIFGQEEWAKYEGSIFGGQFTMADGNNEHE